MEKLRETDISGMIIGEILCLFSYISCSISLLPLEWWSRTQIDESGKGQRQGWDNLSRQRKRYEISGRGGQSWAFLGFKRLRVRPTFLDSSFVYKIWKENRWVRGVRPTYPMRRSMSQNYHMILIVSIFIRNLALKGKRTTSGETSLSV